MNTTQDLMNRRPVLIMAGGTGGHVFPALAVAQEILSRNIPVVWLGTHQGIEARLIPEAGIPVEWVSVSGLRGKGVSRVLQAPFMLMHAAWQCFRILLRIKPKVVLGMGGFVSGPGGVMTRLLGKPLCIHEQNAIAGMTNRYLARISTRVMQAFPDSFPAGLMPVTTGNPVRADINQVPEPGHRFAGRQGPVRLLVLGGSLGAQALNELVPRALSRLAPDTRPTVRHQAGERNIEQTRDAYQQADLVQGVEVVAFITDMAEAYAWADFVICRAGALTVAELTAVGVGALLVPYPYAVDDHQTRNAQFLVEAGAGLMVQQSELDADMLHMILVDLVSDRTRLLKMARSAHALAKKDATRQVADICLQAGEGK
jgi:UDP-N-acetylglucosamine--N-acetylmuramyl-(pentapeptide) pyrophosphoryl-undecaprenol N-acetylglucosamine transferase